MLSERYISQFLRGVPLKGKAVLDVGCGKGEIIDYARWAGAGYIVGLEPKSTSPEKLLPVRFQDYEADEKFDVVIMHDSVNHLDEYACIHLAQNGWAQERYIRIFRKVYSMMNDNGLLVIADASRKNLFADAGVGNPFDKSIEWHKHQEPALWIKLLRECGFTNEQVTWLAPQKLLSVGRLVGNKVVAYFLVSHFRLVCGTKRP